MRRHWRGPAASSRDAHRIEEWVCLFKVPRGTPRKNGFLPFGSPQNQPKWGTITPKCLKEDLLIGRFKRPLLPGRSPLSWVPDATAVCVALHRPGRLQIVKGSLSCGCGSKTGTQNRTLANGNKD